MKIELGPVKGDQKMAGEEIPGMDKDRERRKKKKKQSLNNVEFLLTGIQGYGGECLK